MRIDPDKDYPTIPEIKERMKKGFEIDEEWITRKALEKQDKENIINIRRSKIFK
jgi:hypothetical protein